MKTEARKGRGEASGARCRLGKRDGRKEVKDVDGSVDEREGEGVVPSFSGGGLLPVRAREDRSSFKPGRY